MVIRWQTLRRACLASLLALAALTACAPLPAGPIAPMTPVSPVATPASPDAAPRTPIPEVPMSSPIPSPETAVPGTIRAPRPSERELAVADLAAELGIAPDAITVRTAESVDWRDASLGCAKPGQMYAQVITPGYRIVLDAAGKSYEYHTGGGRIVRCRP